MNDLRNKKNDKSRKNHRKQLLSLILCAALILGMLPVAPVAPPVLAAETTDTSMEIVVGAEGAQCYYDSGNAVKDNSIRKVWFQKWEEYSSTYRNKILNLTKDGNKLTFSNQEDQGFGSYEQQMAYVPFQVTLNAPAYTTRTYTMTFSLDGTAKEGCPGMYFFAQLLEGGVPENFNVIKSENDDSDEKYIAFKGVKMFEPAPKHEINFTVTETLANQSASPMEKTKAFVFFCGEANLGSYSDYISKLTFNCTLDKVTYTETHDTKKISLDANGGTGIDTSKNVKYHEKYGTLPEPTRTGYTFDGWYTEVSGGSRVDSNTTVATDAGDTLYAHWTVKSCNVTFHANGGGTPSQASRTVTYGSTYGTLPTVSRMGYTFAGWYTDANGGDKVEANTTVSKTANHTLYAHWTANRYTITFSGAAGGDQSKTYTYMQTGTVAFPQAADQSGSGKFFIGWQLTYTPSVDPTVNGTPVDMATFYQPGQTLSFNGGARGDMTFTAQYVTVTGTPSDSETLTIKGQSSGSIPTPPEKFTYTVEVTGNDSLKALTIGGTSVTRNGTEDFVLTTTGSGSKEVVIDGENVGSVAANGTLTVPYKTLTVTVNADKTVSLQGGPALTRSGPVNGVYTYTHTARNPGNGSYHILVDSKDSKKTVSYGNTTALTYHTVTATVNAQDGASVNSVELVKDSEVMAMSASASGKYTCSGMAGSSSYTLRVNGTSISGQTTDFSADKELSATIYTKKVTTRLNNTVADIPGVDNVKIGSLSAARTGVGTYLATQVGTDITGTVFINGVNVVNSAAANSVVDYYTVTYNANGGTGAPVDGNVYRKGTQATVLARGGTAKNGCSFLGWINGTTNIAVGAAITVNSKTTFTARWRENVSCEVRWQVPGGELQYGTLIEALDAAGTTPDVTIIVQDGKTANLPSDHTLPESATLIVPAGTEVVSDADGAVLTVKGRIENSGSFATPAGTLDITESGTLINTGTVSCDIKSNAGKIDNTGGTISGNVKNTDSGVVEGGTITNTGTVTGGTVEGPLTNKGNIKKATITGQIDLPGGGKIIDSVVDGNVIDNGGELSYTKEFDGTGVVTTPGGNGAGSSQVQKLLDALGGAGVESPAGTVKLMADVTLTTDPVIINGDVTIDLNGHTITGPDGKPAIQVNGGDVTIKDSSDPDGGSIIGGSGSAGQPGAPGIENKGSGTLTIEGGTVTGGTGGVDGAGAAGIKNTGAGSVVVKGGEVIGGSGGGGESGGEGGSGIENTGDGGVSINGGKVEGGSGGESGDGGSGVTNTGEGTVNVTGGEVTGGEGGRTGQGEGGQGGSGIDSAPDKTTVNPDASVSAGEGGTGGDGTVTLRSLKPSIDAIPVQYYTGGEIKPAVVLRDGAGVIPAGEYIVEYGNNVERGTATVTVKDKPDKQNALYKLENATATFKIEVKSGTTYKVTLHGNEGSGTDLKSYTYGTEVALPHWTRTGYTFKGWYETEAFDEPAVTEISATDYKDKEYWAKWTPNEYTVSFDYQGATGGNNMENMPVTYDSTYGKLPTPTRTNYVFKGWYTQADGNGIQVTEKTTVSTANHHPLYAYWKDETKPDAPVLPDGETLSEGWTGTQKTIPLALYDAVGVTELWVSIDGKVYEKVSGFTGGTSFNYAVLEGSHTYRFKAKDAAGNESAQSNEFKVMLDITKPEFSGDIAVTNPTEVGADITLTPSEGGKAYWIVSNVEPAPSAQEVKQQSGQDGALDVERETADSFTITGLTPGEKHTVYVVLEDVAGNLSEVVKEKSFFTMPEAPEITLEQLKPDYTNETIKLPDMIGKVEVYTDSSDPSGSKVTPNSDGSLPVTPGTEIYIRYPERTEDSLTVPASDKTTIQIPERPATPAPKEVTVTDTTVTVVEPADGEEYALVKKGTDPDWSKANTTGQFTELDARTEYDLYVRKKATKDSFVSEPAKTEIQTYVTIKNPIIEGDGAGKDGNTAPKPDAPEADGRTVTYTGTYSEEYTPVIEVGGQEYIPEMTWDENSKKGGWRYTYSIPDNLAVVKITVEFRNRTITGITAKPDSLKIYADNSVNVSEDALNKYVNANSSTHAVYDNKTSGTVKAAYTTTKDSFKPKGGTYSYTASAGGKKANTTLTVKPVSAAVTAPDKCVQIKKSGGYTKEEVAVWLPAEVTATYTGDDYTARTENRAVTWNTDSLGEDFGAATDEKNITGTVDLPAWATGENSVSMVIEFVGDRLLPDGKSLTDYVDISPEPTDGWYGSDIILTPKDGCSVGETPGDVGKGNVTISDETGTDGSTGNVYVKGSDGSIYRTEFTYKLDKTPPAVDLTDMTVENGTKNLWDWIIGKKSMIIKIPVSGVADALSGIGEVSYAVTPDGGVVGESKIIYAENGIYEIALDEEFCGTIKLTFKDKAGNTTQVTLPAENGKVIAEDYAPVVKIIPPTSNDYGWYNKVIDIAVAVTDDKDSGGAEILSGGIAGIRWKEGENGEEQTVEGLPGTDAPVYEKEFTISMVTDGTHTYYVKAVDNAGNESGWQTVTVKVDTGTPEFSGDIAVTNPTEEGADIAITPSEGGKIYYIVTGTKMGSVAGTAPIAPEVKEQSRQKGGVIDVTGGTEGSFTITGLAPGEKYTVCVVLEDAAGNLSKVKNESFFTRQAVPEITPEQLTVDYTKETIKLPDTIGEVEVYTDPSNPSGSRVTPNSDGSLPVTPGTEIYIRYPERTEDGLTVPAGDKVTIQIPERPVPADMQVAVTDNAVTLTNPDAKEEYVLVKKGENPDWSKANTTGQFTGLDADTEYDLYVRIKATDSNFVSVPAKLELRTKDHTLQKMKAKAPTCTEAGNREYWICSDCHKLFEDGQGKTETDNSKVTIPAAGHKFPEKWTVEKEATQKHPGREYKTCETCGTKTYRIIEPSGTSADPYAGKIEKEVEVLPGAPNTVLNNSKDELAQSILTKEERAEIDSGADARIWLEIVPDVDIAEEEEAQVQKVAEKSVGAGAEVTYFDASLFKQVGNGEKTPIHEPGRPISVTIVIPENIRNKDVLMIRNYQIIRLHDGKTDIIEGTYNEKSAEFTFETDKFSTYAICYKDLPKQAEPEPDESGQTGNDIAKRKDLSILLATGKQKGSAGIRLTWLKWKGASGYEVYWSYCDGKRNFKKLKTVKAKAKRTYTHKKLKRNRAYKYYIATYKKVKGKKKYVAKSPVIHVAMKYEKRTNAKKITANKTKVILSLTNKKYKKKFKIRVKVKKENRKKKLLSHAAKLRYYTDNKKAAKVSRTGKITAKGRGKCTVYVTANNGVCKKIKVTVK